MSGLGTQPLGASPLGIGEADTASVPGGTVFRDAYTSAQHGGRMIDPRTKQYTYDANGRALGMPATMQRVQIAVTTALGSSAQSDLGNQLNNVRTISDSFVNEVRAYITSALQSMIDSGAIVVNGIDVDQATDRDGAVATIHFTDQATKEQQSLTV